jgi:transcriptional regulator with AAA-type ATPase domain
VSRLLVTHGHHFGVCYELLDKTTLGRSSACTIQLLDEKVSRLHSTILRDDDRFVVNDEGSSNGTGVNGRLLLEPHPLKPGDEVAVGNNLLLFEPDLEILRDLDGAGSVILAAAAGQTVESARPGSGTREGAFKVEALLAEIAEMLGGPRGVGRPAALVEAAIRGLGAERGALLVAPTGGEPMKAVATFPHRGRVTISRDLVHRVLEQRAPRAVGDGLIELIVRNGRSLIEARAGCAVGIPIALGGRIRGIFFAESSERDLFDGLPVDLIQSVIAVTFTHLLAGPPGALRPPQPMVSAETPIASSPGMQAVLEQARGFAEDSSPVLIRGEPGTGKAFVARWIHKLSPRSEGPFVAVHCGTLPDKTADSTLFGHEKGAFSGADRQHAGYLEQADGGTLLLDAVGELTPPLQVKLLRAVQEGRFYRVGGTRPVRVDLRLICGSFRDLTGMVLDGALRQDLYERLDVVRLDLAPLRDRIADVAPLLERFVARFNARNGCRLKGFTPEAIGLLEGFGWPGNVRQLRDVVERVLVRAPGDFVEADDVQEELDSLLDPDDLTDETADLIADLEHDRLARALARCRGNKGRAALMLRVTRGTLDRLIAVHEVDEFGQG